VVPKITEYAVMQDTSSGYGKLRASIVRSVTPTLLKSPQVRREMFSASGRRLIAPVAGHHRVYLVGVGPQGLSYQREGARARRSVA
jgi:hypothetical protein